MDDPFLVEFRESVESRESTHQLKEVLAKRRRNFVLIRWTWRLVVGAMCAALASSLTWDALNGEMGEKWFPALLFMLLLLFSLWGLERARFCPDCNALFGAPRRASIPAYCTNCHRLLHPEKVLLDPPGVLDLNNERYLEEAQLVVQLIAMVILVGIKDRSTEIRLEPGAEEFRICYRCGGVLYDMVPPPLYIHKAVTGTLKAMSRLDPERRPESGNLEIKVIGHTITARVESEPTEFGENVVVWLPEMSDDPCPNMDEFLRARIGKRCLRRA